MASDTLMLCRVCPGTGWLASFTRGALEFWRCPCCGGDGARVVYSPAMIGPGSRFLKAPTRRREAAQPSQQENPS
jgi:ribosomal protein L37AE/L43A